MPLPHAVARFNRRVTNRWIEPIARRSSGFAVVHHAGRCSGVAYRTPVNVFEMAGDPNDLVVALTYGPSADWCRNVLAGGGTVERRAVVHRIAAATLVDRDVAWPALPRLVRGALRLLRVRHFLRLELDPGDA